MQGSIVIAAVYSAAQALVFAVAGDGSALWLGEDLHLYATALIVSFVLCGAVGYLGDVCYDFDWKKAQADTALHSLGTMFEIAQLAAVIRSGVDDLVNRVTQTISGRHPYGVVAIYLLEAEPTNIRLGCWIAHPDLPQAPPGWADGLTRKAATSMEAQVDRHDRLVGRSDTDYGPESPIGVLLLGSEGPVEEVSGALGLGDSLAGQIALAVQIARLQGRLSDVATSDEWEQTTREIHAGISSSMYALRPHLDTYAALARRENNPLEQRLGELVMPTKQLLLDTRLYLYYLLPVLRGDGDLKTVVEGQAREFERIAGIPVHLSTSGSLNALPIWVIAGFYNVLQTVLNAVLNGSSASRVVVHLEMNPGIVSLGIIDDSEGNSSIDPDSSPLVEKINRTAHDMGGRLRVVKTGDAGAHFLLDLDLLDGQPRVDQDSHS